MEGARRILFIKSVFFCAKAIIAFKMKCSIAIQYRFGI